MLGSEDYALTQLNLPHNTVELPEEDIIENLKHPEIPVIIPEDGDLIPSATKHLKDALVIIERLDKKHAVIFEPRTHAEKVMKKLFKLINALKLLQLHFDFLLEVLTAPSDEDLPEILIKYSPIHKHYNRIVKKADVCLLSLCSTFENVIYFLLDEIEKATDSFFLTKEDGTVEVKNDKKTVHHVQIMASKLETTLEYFPGAMTLEPDDLFAQAKSSEVWKKLHGSCEMITFGDKDTIKNRYKPLYKLFKIANAIVYKTEKKARESFKERLGVVLSGLSYGTKHEKAELKASLYLSEVKMESAFQVWNFVEKGWVQDIVQLTLPTIDYDKKVYIHRLFPSINKETILREYEEGTLNKITENTFKPIDLTAKKDLILESIFKKQADAVKMRIISPFPLVLKGINSEKARAMAMKAVNKVNKLLTRGKSVEFEPDGIIFHIHGGGFVSGSSSSHRTYLYRWAKSLKKIIISVDYRLAPDYPYPAGLDDVWQAYNWVINYAEPLLGIKTNKIVLAGDSAGGNLVMALTLRCIKMGVRVPDGCMLAYPAMNLYPQRFVPSYYLALEDTILPYSLLKLCLKAYVAEEFKPELDPFLSPVNAEDQLLEKLPPIKILTGTDDPLHDDNWRFLHKMQRLDKDIKMFVYEHMPHGFFSFDQIEGYKILLEGACKVLGELFGELETEPLSPEQEPEQTIKIETEQVTTKGSSSTKRQIFRGVLDRVFKTNTNTNTNANTNININVNTASESVNKTNVEQLANEQLAKADF